jgi:hypothetical protein
MMTPELLQVHCARVQNLIIKFFELTMLYIFSFVSGIFSSASVTSGYVLVANSFPVEMGEIIGSTLYDYLSV